MEEVLTVQERVKAVKDFECQELIKALREFGEENEEGCHEVHFEEKPVVAGYSGDYPHDITILAVTVNAKDELTFLGFETEDECDDDAREYSADDIFAGQIEYVTNSIKQEE